MPVNPCLRSVFPCREIAPEKVCNEIKASPEAAKEMNDLAEASDQLLLWLVTRLARLCCLKSLIGFSNFSMLPVPMLEIVGFAD